ncbi:MAG: BlaI/MecI/CopY family transcriptional regulator [Saprospiraceae bacterium]|nr:BlaI/MecI/CopY family transcriptional regulator [Saprospiraceae bacterium]
MKKLTASEEEVMQHIWDLGACTVSQILERYDDPPPHSTVSSVARILEKKGFVDHKAYGRTYEYYPIVSQRDYKRGFLTELLTKYFGDSPKALVSFLVQEEKIDADEMEQLIDSLKE